MQSPSSAGVSRQPCREPVVGQSGHRGNPASEVAIAEILQAVDGDDRALLALQALDWAGSGARSN